MKLAVSSLKTDEIRARLLKMRVFGALGQTAATRLGRRPGDQRMVTKPFKFQGFGALEVTHIAPQKKPGPGGGGPTTPARAVADIDPRGPKNPMNL